MEGCKLKGHQEHAPAPATPSWTVPSRWPKTGTCN